MLPTQRLIVRLGSRCVQRRLRETLTKLARRGAGAGPHVLPIGSDRPQAVGVLLSRLQILTSPPVVAGDHRSNDFDGTAILAIANPEAVARVNRSRIHSAKLRRDEGPEEMLATTAPESKINEKGLQPERAGLQEAGLARKR